MPVRTLLALSVVLGSADLRAEPGASEGEATPAECGLEDPAIAAAAPRIAPKPSERAWRSAGTFGPSVRVIGHSLGSPSVGALSGKTVYLSPGHGFTYIPAASGWRTQRGNSHELVEDLISVEALSTYLVRYLRAMGATVVPVRELDFRRERVIVDDLDPSFSLGDAEVLEEGVGFGHLDLPITGNENPFDAGGHKVLTATAEGEASTEVRWTLDVEEGGDYNLYIGFVADPSRASDAHYVVHHPAGATHFRVDQRRHGGTWVFLGRFHFEAGSDPVRGAVSLVSDSAEPGASISADVVRIGGGMGPFDRGGGVSERPMFEHAARYYAQWAGAPETVYDYTGTDRSSDVGARARFAAWDHEEGEDAVYVAWHTNAPSPGRGTSSYAYSSVASGTVEDFEGVPGSLELMDAIHTQLIADLRRGWSTEWNDRGQRTAFFGEVNPSHNPEMPSTLIEVAFHDTAADADFLRDPQFRNIAARAIARGVATYFASRDGVEVVLPPETPTGLSVVNIDGSLVAKWQPQDGADHYIVYTSPNGRSFGNGIASDTAEFVLEDPLDLTYLRVSAANAAGESLPSRLVGARVAVGRGAPVLVVSGFERLDGSMLLSEDLSEYGLETVERGFVSRINDGSHVARYGNAIASYGAGFDSADASAIARNDVSLSGYAAVIWFTGESSDSDDPLGASARVLLADYLEAGGQLFVSGSELAWTYDNILADEHSEFFRSLFGVAYVADDADTYDLENPRGLFSELDGFSFSDSGEGGYDANFPDVLEAVSGEAVLDYAGGGTAAVHAPSLGVVFFGFPFETVAGSETRAALMSRVLVAFDVDPEPDEEPDPDEGGCGCRSSGSGGGGLAVLALLVAGLASSRTRWPKHKQTSKTA